MDYLVAGQRPLPNGARVLDWMVPVVVTDVVDQESGTSCSGFCSDVEH